jgi:hypothetical protein
MAEFSTIINDISGVTNLSTISNVIFQNLSDNLSMISTVFNDISGADHNYITDMMSTLMNKPPPPISILSLDDLLNTVDYELQKEAEDRVIVNSFMSPGYDALKTMLKPWAKAGFPTSFLISSIELNVPPVCADGVSRSLSFYFEYLLGVSIATALQNLATNTSGMSFTYSHNGSNRINLHITKC